MIQDRCEIRNYVTRIKERPDLVSNPSFLHLITAYRDFELSEGAYDRMRQNAHALEGAIGQGLMFRHEYPGDLSQLDLPSITRSLNMLATGIAAAETRVKDCLLRDEGIIEFQRRIQDAKGLNNDTERKKKAQELRQYADWMANAWKSSLHQYECLSKNVQAQIAVVYSYTAQRENALNIEIAKDSKSIAAACKRDSSAMKSIALLTMLFLPGTFVSVRYLCPNPCTNAD
ncbi:MAG: hypothetical protein Q9163_004371 [Psora crenata]